MCGRFRLSRRKQVIEKYFSASSLDDVDWEPRYNIAPTQEIPVIRQKPRVPIRELSLVLWGAYPVMDEGCLESCPND
jgi:putative SOS response-associated peptidase YedK